MRPYAELGRVRSLLVCAALGACMQARPGLVTGGTTSPSTPEGVADLPAPDNALPSADTGPDLPPPPACDAPELGQPCGLGPCAGGALVCSSEGAVVCSTAHLATAPGCTGADLDCNGQPDPVGCPQDDPCQRKTCGHAGTCEATPIQSPNCGVECIPSLDPIATLLFGRFDVHDVAVKGSLAFAATGAGLEIYDTGDPGQPKGLAYATASGATRVEVDGAWCYLGTGSGLRVYDVSDPSEPLYLGDSDAGALLAASGGRLVNAMGGLLRIYEASDPLHPVFLGQVDTGALEIRDVWVEGDRLWLAGGASFVLAAVDAANPAKPSLLGKFLPKALPDYEPKEPPYILAHARGVQWSGGRAYVANGARGLEVFDVADPASPVHLERYETSQLAEQVAVVGTQVFLLTDYDGLHLLDATNPAALAPVDTFTTSTSTRRLVLHGDRVYLPDEELGLRVAAPDPATGAYTLHGGFTKTDGFAEGIVVEGDLAFLADGFTGLRVLDVSNPHLPGQIGALDTEGYAEAIVRQGDLVYVADNAKGLRIIDVSAPNTPQQLGIFSEIGGAAVSVGVSGDTIYLRDSASGLLVLDAADPAQPILRGSVALAGDGSALEVGDGRVYVSDGWKGVRVVDVSDPAAPTLLGSYDVFGYVSALAVVGTIAYAAYGNDGVRALDVAAPAAIAELGLFKPSGSDYVWQVRPVADLLYLANGGAGIRVFDVSGAADPVEVATYDTLGYARDVDVQGAYVFAADGSNLLQVFEVGCAAEP